jgi:Tol biopolymer transport system component
VGELDRGTLVRLTSDPATDRNPVWSPDGDRIAFASNQTGAWEVLLRVPDGTGDATVLATFDSEAQEVWPWGWSPDGSTLTVVVRGATSADIGTIPSDGSGTWEPLIQTEAEEEMPAIAPNGQWIAYMSDETGNFEVYLQRYPDLGGRRLVSVGGGTDPIWSSDSRELLYGRGGPPDAMMRVTVDVAGDDRSALTVGTPELLFDYRYRAARFSRNYGLSPDGQRLLMITGDAPPEGDTATQIILVQNFAEELTRLVPVD